MCEGGYKVGERWTEEIKFGHRNYTCVLDVDNRAHVKDLGLSCNEGYENKANVCRKKMPQPTKCEGKHPIGSIWSENIHWGYWRFKCERNKDGRLQKVNLGLTCLSGYEVNGKICTKKQKKSPRFARVQKS